MESINAYIILTIWSILLYVKFNNCYTANTRERKQKNENPQSDENTFCLYHVQFSRQPKISKQRQTYSHISQKLILNK